MKERKPSQGVESTDVGEWLVGGGEMGERTRALDWSATPVGPMAEWPQSLKTTVSVCLGSRYPIVIWWGKHALTQFYNDAFISFLGAVKHPGGLGQSARECWSEIWDILAPMLDGVFVTGEATWSEDFLYVIARNLPREEGYFTFSYSPIRDDAGAVAGIFCACYETTGRVIGERRLRTLRDLSRMVVEAKAVEGACEVAARILCENPADVPFSRIYLVDAEAQYACLVATIGGEAGDASAPHLIDLRSSEDRPATWPLERVFNSATAELIPDLSGFGPLSGGPWPEKPEAAIVLPIAAPGQIRPTGFLVSGFSPRRVVDSDYRSFFDLIAGHVGTAIANARAYEEERKRAEALAELDRAKTAFFSNVSHEFRTPLTLMLGPLEETLAGGEGLSPADRERLEVTYRNSLRLLKLVNSLLDFSRIEAGRIQAVYEPVNLADYTAELASVFRSAIEKAGMRLVVNCPPLSQPVYVDREMWEKIVLNLLSNAFKFTFEGEIKVRLEQAGEMVELIVSDTGTGIPAEELPQLFERFFRVKGARGRSFEGSGIGLALVLELVKLHGGNVRVTSEFERGSAFTVSIPTGKTHLPADRIGAARPLASTSLRSEVYLEEALRWLPDAPQDGQPIEELISRPLEKQEHTGLVSLPQAGPVAGQKRILLADDNADMRDYLRRLLSESGYNIVATADGEAALVAARDQSFDLVLTDVMMPKLDGFGLLKALRADDRTATTPVILLSARAGEESRVEGLEKGADDYLVKPFSARELLARVESNLMLAHLRREEEARTAADLQAMKLLHEIGNLCASAGHNFDLCLKEIVATAIAVTGADKGNLQLLEDESGTLRIAAQRGFADPFLKFFARVSNKDAAERVIVEDVTQSEIFAGQPSLKVLLEANVRALQSTPLVSSSGQVFGMISTHFRLPHRPGDRDLRLMDLLARQTADYLERRLAEEALQTRDTQLQMLFDTTPIGVYLVDADFRILQVNPTARPFFGDIPDLIGRNFDEVTHILWTKECADETVRLFRHTFETGEPYFTPEHKEERSDLGVTEYYEGQINRIPLQDGRHGVVCYFRDISAEVNARKAVEEANRLKDEFLATLSHELRNPLNSITGYADVLLRNAEASRLPIVRQAAGTIRRNAETQAQLINDLLDLSRLQTGKLTVNRQPMALAPVVSDAVESVRAQTVEKELKLEVDFPSESLVVNADPVRVQQIVWNLVDNAVKFTPEGGRVSVSLSHEGEAAKLVIEDNGQGIQRAFLPHLFEMFRQAEGGTKRRHGGMGIGLALVKQLVGLHGGKIEAFSEGEGRGARFTVNLPLDTRTSPEQTASLRTTKGDLSGARILVVDDSQDSLEILRSLLSDEGAEVKTARNGEEGLRMGKDAEFDLIISDISMPVMDGYEFLKNLRESRPRYANIPAIALTGFGREEDVESARQAGFTIHLTKPLDIDQLLWLAWVMLQK